MINCFCIWTIGDGWEVGVGLGGVVWEVGSNSLSGAGTIALVLAEDCELKNAMTACAEQKALKDFLSFLKTQNFG
jgi:hypothetical protein